MDHRHMWNAPQILETDSDQGWNQSDHPYAHASASENSSHIHRVDNMVIQSGQIPSHWNPAPRSSGYSSTIHNGELPHYHPRAPGPSLDPFAYQFSAGNIHMLQDNYSHNPSSSHPGAQTIPGVDIGFHDHTMGSGRGPYKRKTPSIPPVCERGSTSRYYDVGSSSHLQLPANPWQDKQNAEYYHAPPEYPPSYRVPNLSIGNEGTGRNVRSRTAVDLDSNLARTHLSSNSAHHGFSNLSSDQSNSMHFWGQNPNPSTREWNHGFVPSVGHGPHFGSGSSFTSRDLITLNMQNSHPIGSLETGGYRNDVSSNTNHVTQNVNSYLNQSARGFQCGHGQPSVPTFRASSNNFHPGHVVASDEGLQMMGENYPLRHPRPFSNLRFRNIDRNVRTLISSDRYRSSTEEANFRDRLTPEGLMIVDHPAFYGSRNILDQHGDMQLDVDNMSYEELLALGERIGSVSTGLTDGLISKCMTESIYCSSDLFQDEGVCVICLEEYKNMDDVGTLKVCGHDFHVSCVRKWLSMKNVCPICKAAAVDDGMKGK